MVDLSIAMLVHQRVWGIAPFHPLVNHQIPYAPMEFFQPSSIGIPGTIPGPEIPGIMGIALAAALWQLQWHLEISVAQKVDESKVPLFTVQIVFKPLFNNLFNQS